MAYVRRAQSAAKPKSGEPVAPRGTKGRLRVLGGESGPGVPLEKVVGRVLRYGSLVSVTLILMGIASMAWSIRFGSQGLPSIPKAGDAAPFHDPAGLLAGLQSGDPSAVTGAGLLVLIATPVIRVASTVVYFLLHRDKPYLAITSFVLLVLIAGFLIGSEG